MFSLQLSISKALQYFTTAIRLPWQLVLLLGCFTACSLVIDEPAIPGVTIDPEILRAEAMVESVKKSPSIEVDSIEQIINTANSIFRQKNYAPGIASAFAALALHANKTNRYTESIAYADSAIQYTSQLDLSDKKYLIVAHNAAELSYLYMGMYIDALKENQRVFEISREIQDTLGMIKAIGNGALIYKETGNLKKSRQNLQRTLLLSKSIQNYRMVALSYINLGYSFSDSPATLDSNRYYIKLAHDLVEQHDIASLRLLVLANLAEINIRAKNYPEALRQGKKILEASKGKDPSENNVYGYYITANASYMLGDNITAELYFNKGIALSKKLKRNPLIAEGKNRMAEYYRHRKDYRLADLYSQEVINLEDKISGEKVKRQLDQLRTTAAIQRSEKELDAFLLAQLKKEEEFENASIQLTTYVLLMLAIGIVFILNLQQQRLSLTARHEQLVAEGKLEILRSQMNPQFIYSSFGGIQKFILKSEKMEAYNYLGKFASLLRMTLENSKDTFVAIQQEIQVLTHYLELEQLRLHHQFTYTIDLPPELEESNIRIPSMMIQPYLEDAIINGFTPRTKSGEIHLKFRKLEKVVLVEIRDNRHGQPLQGSPSGNSLFLEGGAQRLKFLRQVGYENARIEIADQQQHGQSDGKLVRITLPIV